MHSLWFETWEFGFPARPRNFLLFSGDEIVSIEKMSCQSVVRHDNKVMYKHRERQKKSCRLT